MSIRGSLSHHVSLSHASWHCCDVLDLLTLSQLKVWRGRCFLFLQLIIKNNIQGGASLVPYETEVLPSKERKGMLPLSDEMGKIPGKRGKD